MLRNRLLAATAALALASAQVSPCYAALPSPQLQTPDGSDPLKAANAGFVATAIANLQTAIISLLGGKLSHVANTSGLATLTVYSVPIMRDDIGVIYADTGASCTTSGGDGGWQIQPATGHCWQTDISKGAPISLWGAVANDITDAQPAVVKAAAALSGLGGGRIVVPASMTCFILKAGVVIPANVTIRGEPGSCLDRGFASGNLIQLGTLASAAANSGAYDLYIKHSVTASTFNASVRNSAGNVVTVAVGSGDVVGVNAPFGHMDRINCQPGAYFCVTAENSGPYYVHDLVASADGQSAVALGCQEGGGEPADVHIDGFDIAFQHRAAMELCFVGGATIANGNTDFNQYSIWAHPGQALSGSSAVNITGRQVSAIYAVNSYFDFSTKTGLLIDGSQGQITEWALDPTVWVASAGSTVPSTFASQVVGTIPQDTNADGIFITGTNANIVDNRFFAHVFNNTRNGIYYANGVHNQLGGVATQNCMNSDNNSGATCAGLSVAPNLVNWSWDGKCGGTTGSNIANPQNYGVVIASGSSDFYTVRGDCSGNATGAVLDGGTGVHKNFDEVLPGVPWPTFPATYGATSGSFGSTPTGAFAYRLSGSTVSFSATVSIATNGSAGGSVTISLPILASTGATLFARNQTTGAGLMGVINSGQAQVNIQTLTAGYPGADNTTITVSGSYQAAQP